MNWLNSLFRPKIGSQATGNKDKAPDNLWQSCTFCGAMNYKKDLVANFYVCSKCQRHLPLQASVRLDLLFGKENWKEVAFPISVEDPLKFSDTKSYKERLKKSRKQTSLKDCVLVAQGNLDGNQLVVGVFDFAFMGGSMGISAGNGIVAAANAAVKKSCPLLFVTSSGGARMQEGILSLMQMPRSIAALATLREQKLAVIILQTHPTTGGVSASFATAGDIIFAEPKATIGFAGARVIQQTIKEKLPEGFQTAESLVKQGHVDGVVHRKDLKKTLTNLLFATAHKPSFAERWKALRG